MARSKTHRVSLLRTTAISTALLLSAGLSSTALAQAAPDSAAHEVGEVVVTGKSNFLSVDTSGATGLPVPIEKVPQSISLVSSDFLRAADLKTIGDVADYTPGAVYGGTGEGVGASLKLRGFRIGSGGGGQALDGLQVNEFFNADYATTDRLEIVKGPASVIYGVSSPGGLVNRVTKSATASTPDYLSVQYGSWNNVRVEGQFADKLDEEGRFRVIGVGVVDEGDSFQDVINHKTYVLYGGINADFSSALTGFVHFDYEHHERTSFDGIPTEPDGSPAPLPRSFFIGTKDDVLTTDVYSTDADLTWHASNVLDLNLKGQLEYSNTTGKAPFSFGLDTAGDLGLQVETYAPRIERDYGVGASVVYRLDNFGIKDSFVSVAALYQVIDTVNNELSTEFPANPSGVDQVGLSNINLGEAAISQAFANAVTGPDYLFHHRITTNNLTLTTQSIIQPIDHLSLLFGASYSKPDITYANDGVREDLSPKGQVSLRAGVTYEFFPGANIYGSFSQSFLPQQFLNLNGAVLPPTSGNQYEAGLKWRVLHNRLLLTAAYFDIKQQNNPTFTTNVPGVGDEYGLSNVEHRGVELEALGKLTPNWQIVAGYAYLDPTITSDGTAADAGKTDIFLPKNTASLFTSYDLPDGPLKGFTFGAGIRYVGSQKTSLDGSSGDLRDYTVVDGVISYDFAKWSVQLNLKNILDRAYYINNYDTLFYGNSVGEPRSVQVTLRRQF
jgi:TonB-dependent siderophore receptor